MVERIKDFIYHKSYSLRVLSEPVQVFEGYSYNVELEATHYHIFNIKVYSKKW